MNKAMEQKQITEYCAQWGYKWDEKYGYINQDDEDDNED